MTPSETKQKIEELYKALPETFTFPVGFSIAKGIGFKEWQFREYLKWEIQNKRIEPNINKYKKK